MTVVIVLPRMQQFMQLSTDRPPELIVCEPAYELVLVECDLTGETEIIGARSKVPVTIGARPANAKRGRTEFQFKLGIEDLPPTLEFANDLLIHPVAFGSLV